jgi:DNA repair protein RadD
MNLDESTLEFNSTGSDFTDASLKKFYDANDINHKIKNRVEFLASSGVKSILVFVALVAEAKYLETIIPKSVAIYGDMPQKDRDLAIRKFKSGEISIALNVNVLGTGFDFPGLQAIVHARPTGSVNLYYQHIGRLVRISAGKSSGIVIDLSGNYERFGRVEDFEFREDEKYGWGMFSKDKILTEYSLKASKKKAEKVVIAVPSESLKPENYLMPFGKHSGKKISEIEKGYLSWLASEKFEANTPNARTAKKTVCLYLESIQKEVATR